MIKYLNLIFYFCFILLLYSCQDQENHLENKNLKKIDSLKKQEFFNGHILKPLFPISNKEYVVFSSNIHSDSVPDINILSSKDSFYSSTLKELLSYKHLKQLNLTEEKLIDAYYKTFNTTPEGITINDYKSTRAPSFNLSSKYQWQAYIETEKPILDTIYKEQKKIVQDVDTLINTSSIPMKITSVINHETSITKSWNSLVSAGISFSGKVSIKSFFETGVEIKVGVTNSKGELILNKIIKRKEYQINVPAKTRMIVVLRQFTNTSKIRYTIPIKISGLVGLNYSKKNNGHYYWGAPASKLLYNHNSDEIGEIIDSETLNTTIYIGEEQSLTEHELKKINQKIYLKFDSRR